MVTGIGRNNGSLNIGVRKIWKMKWVGVGKYIRPGLAPKLSYELWFLPVI